MIKVNLVGASRKKAGKRSSGGGGGGRGFKIAMPTSIMPLICLLVVVGSIVGGYLWYSQLAGQSSTLDTKISSLQAQKAQLDAVIKENQVYESRKKALENRIKVIEALKRNQVNPIVAFDVLSEAIERTQYVWLSQLDQNNSILSMAGTGTSIDAIADFVANLQNSRYFRNPELAHATDSAGNFTFSLKCEFVQPNRIPT